MGEAGRVNSSDRMKWLVLHRRGMVPSKQSVAAPTRKKKHETGKQIPLHHIIREL